MELLYLQPLPISFVACCPLTLNSLIGATYLFYISNSPNTTLSMVCVVIVVKEEIVVHGVVVSYSNEEIRGG